MISIAAAKSSASLAVARVIPVRGRDWRHQFVSVLCHSHTYSGRADHGGTVRPPESYQRLAAWARGAGIDAIGVGSPYTPAASALYDRYDGEGRQSYYDDAFDKKSLFAIEQDEVAEMLRQMNACADDRVLFYLDNETPKGRYGHLWWIGHKPDHPAWHDYDQPYDRWMLHDPAALGDGDEPLPYERRPYMQIVTAQRAAGALGIWAHPTSWWNGKDGRFITNIATEMPAHAIADGFLDGIVAMGYSPERPEYQDIWFALLDMGIRVPGLAEMDIGLSQSSMDEGPMLLNYAPRLEAGVGESVSRAFRKGRTFASSGPMVDLRVDGARPGDVVASGRRHRHLITITARPASHFDRLERVELVGRGGEVLWSGAHLDGTVDVDMDGVDQCGYLVVRAMGAVSHYKGKPNRRAHYAISNPVYLHPSGQSFARPAQTRLTLRFAEGSEWIGGDVCFESADGSLLGRARITSGEIVETLPASARFTLRRDGQIAKTEYLINANARLLDLQRYLYRGRFLRDFPTARSGEVPVAAWRLNEHFDAMRELTLER